MSSVALKGQVTFEIDKQVLVQPIQITSTDGTTKANASRQLNLAETDKIWAQAGIQVEFLPWTTYSNNSYLNIASSGTSTPSLSILSQYPTIFSGSSNPQVINMWFVQSLDGGAVSGATSGTGGRAIAIANGFQLDVIAHEIGHALGLGHGTYGAGNDQPQNLMTDGLYRTFPSSIGNIFPEGNDLSQLTAQQISAARGSSYLTNYTAVPEPATYAAVIGACLLGFTMTRRYITGRASKGTMMTEESSMVD